uniref:(northern house mosquito) hypothetical protein n=1 Tax=Culex pipiens TaxID=7175 RepID=A0A8D8CWP4_CULPI
MRPHGSNETSTRIMTIIGKTFRRRRLLSWTAARKLLELEQQLNSKKGEDGGPGSSRVKDCNCTISIHRQERRYSDTDSKEGHVLAGTLGRTDEMLHYHSQKKKDQAEPVHVPRTLSQLISGNATRDSHDLIK